MPYISIESGKLTAEKKKQLIERLTATAFEITHINCEIPRLYTSVLVSFHPI